MARKKDEPNAITAAAVRADIDADLRGGVMPHYDRWQDEVWHMYDVLGEFRQAVTWKSNVVSRARLVAAFVPDRQGDEPAFVTDENDPASITASGIAGGIGGQADLLRSLTVHLDVPGEGWLVAEDPSDDTGLTSWQVYAADEIKIETHRKNDRKYFIRSGLSKWKELPAEAIPIRVWRPHDRHHWEADSTARAALPIMRRLELLNRHVDAQAMSRLAMNGVYWIASEIMFPQSDEFPDADDPFIAEFMANGQAAIKNPGSAGAAFPIVNRAPKEYIEKGIRYDTFASPFDQKVLELREFEVRRLATATDVPPEVLLGMAGVNHWGAWQIEESALKTTVISTLEMVCWSLTKNYLWPTLETIMPKNEARKRVIWYDVSELSVRPDRSQDAITLGEKLIINQDAIIRETGFDNSDLLLDEDEIRRAVGLRLLGARDSSSVTLGLQLLGLVEVEEGRSPVRVTDDEDSAGGFEDDVPPSRVPDNSGDDTSPPATSGAPPTNGAPRPTRG